MTPNEIRLGDTVATRATMSACGEVIAFDEERTHANVRFANQTQWFPLFALRLVRRGDQRRETRQ